MGNEWRLSLLTTTPPGQILRPPPCVLRFSIVGVILRACSQSNFPAKPLPNPHSTSTPTTAMEPLVQNYHGRWITDEEMLLVKHFEAIQEERADEVRAKRMEREIMAQRSLSMQQVY